MLPRRLLAPFMQLTMNNSPWLGSSIPVLLGRARTFEEVTESPVTWQASRTMRTLRCACCPGKTTPREGCTSSVGTGGLCAQGQTPTRLKRGLETSSSVQDLTSNFTKLTVSRFGRPRGLTLRN